MENFLEAPVPFVVGTIKNPYETQIPDDIFILHAPKDLLISSEPIASLPNWEELYPFFLFFLFVLFYLLHLLFYFLNFFFFFFYRAKMFWFY